MAFSLVASVNAGGDSTSVTTSAIDTTGVDLIVVWLTWYQPGGSSTLTDSKGNTWSGLTERVSGSGLGGRMYYCLNPTVGSGHTFSSSSAYPLLAVQAFSGAHATSSYEAESGAAGTAGTIQPGSLTPSEDDCLLVTGCGMGDTNGTMTVDGSFTEPQTEADGAAFCVAAAYKIQTTAGADNPTWTITAGGYGNAAALAVFKAAAGGAPAGQPTTKRWGGVPHTGTQKLHGGHRGGPWGYSHSGRVIVPRWLSDSERRAA